MEIKREHVGKVAILDKAVNELNELVSRKDISKAEALGIIRRLNKRLQEVHGEVVVVDKIQEDSLLYVEQLEDLVSSINYNYTYYAAEIDLLNSVAKVVSSYIDGEIERAKESLNKAADIIGVLKVYLESKSKNPHAISVTRDDLSGGDFSLFGNNITAKESSSKKSSVSSIDVRTNGMVGNLLELEKSVPIFTPLNDSDVKFIDERNIFNNKARLKDSSLNTVFELEAYEVDSAVAEQLILLDIKKRAITEENRGASFVPVLWNKSPENNVLTATISVESSNTFNTITIEPNLINTYQKVRSITVSSAGENWTSIVEDVFLVPDINKFDENFSHQKGLGVFYVPLPDIRYAKIHLEQDTPYKTNIAHCFYHKEGETTPMYGEFWSVTNEDKLDFFKSDTIKVNNVELGKDAMAIPGKRWSISLSNISLSLNKYNRESVVETKEFHVNGKVLKLGLSSKEIIPDGCAVVYEISHDGGFTWTKINPIERTEGAEIISFSNNEFSSDLNSVKYVEVDSLPSSLRLRVTISTDRNKTPIISNLILNPIVSLED